MRLHAVWSVVDRVNGETVANRSVNLDTDVSDADEAFKILRSVALQPACDMDGKRTTVQSITGLLYEDGQYIAAVPAMLGSEYIEKGYFCDMRNAAFWPVN